MDKRIFLIREYIKENIHRQFSLEELAEKAGLSVSRLCFLFKEEEEISPIRYIINLRLAEARKILEVEESPIIKQVSLRVGFNSANRFIKEFKKTYRTSPKNYFKEKWLEQQTELEKAGEK